MVQFPILQKQSLSITCAPSPLEKKPEGVLIARPSTNPRDVLHRQLHLFNMSDTVAEAPSRAQANSLHQIC